MITSSEPRELEAQIQGRVCAVCGARLEVATTDELFTYRILCPRDPSHEGMVRDLSDQERVRQGRPLTTQRQQGEKAFLEHRAKPGGEVSLAIRYDDGKGELVSEERLAALQEWAQPLGLNVWYGHAGYMYGQPYITAEGYSLLAHRSVPDLHEVTRPGSRAEKGDMNLAEDDWLWYAELRNGSGQYLTCGWGIVTRDEWGEMSKKRPDHHRSPVVHAKPNDMAEKRALRDAYRRVAPLGDERREP